MKHFKIGRGLIALAITVGSVGAVSAATMSTAGAADCGITNWTGLVSPTNNSWVSAELGYQAPVNGMLRARASAQGAWEKFQFVATSDHHIAIKSLASGKYITADLAYPTTHPNYGVLLARASVIGPWEKFDQVSGFGCALRSVANGRYVSAELSYTGANYGMLRARATTIGPWELFGNKRASNNGCMNPLAGNTANWTLERTDQGVDYGSHGTQPVKAICDGVVLSTAGNGWPGGVFIYYKFTLGPWAGKCSFVAEELNNLQVHAGSTVKAGQVMAYAYDQTEWGWAQAPGRASTPYPPGADHNVPTEGGKAFARFLRSLGAPTLQDPGPGPQYAGASC